jgi:hypothetical protein
MLPGRGFEFDSSFVGPQSENRFRKFADLMLALQKQDDADPKRFPRAPSSGTPIRPAPTSTTRVLAGRRARAVYAAAVRNTKIWESLYSNPHSAAMSGDCAPSGRCSPSPSSRESPRSTPDPWNPVPPRPKRPRQQADPRRHCRLPGEPRPLPSRQGYRSGWPQDPRTPLCRIHGRHLPRQ